MRMADAEPIRSIAAGTRPAVLVVSSAPTRGLRGSSRSATMHNTEKIVVAFVVAVFASASGGRLASAQEFPRKAPAAADWAALARLPDFNGVWEVTLGAGPRGRPSGPSLTPEYAEKKKAFDAAAPEDNQTANCLPPGMPGIMSQPYPMEFLLTPGQV